MRNDKSNLLSTIAFLVIAILFLAFVFFWIFISIDWVFSNKYLGSSITPSAYIYEKDTKIQDKNWYRLLPTTKKVDITNCGNYYCLSSDGMIIEKPRIQVFIIKDF
jgi:hypothetical protein